MRLREQFEQEVNCNPNDIDLHEQYVEWLEDKVEQRLKTAAAVDTIVIGSLPNDEDIEDKACEYIDEQIYINTGEGHDTCREWAFADGAKWVRDLLSNDQ